MMELAETIDVLNRRLLEYFGRFDGGEPLWRIVFSDDQREIRRSDAGIYMEMKKYPFIHHKYVLERIFPVPSINRDELVTRTTYEPVWVFMDGHNNYLPPRWDVAEIVIKKVNQKAGEMVGVDKDPMRGTEEEVRHKVMADIDALEYALFGDASRVGDALATKNAVVLDNR